MLNPLKGTSGFLAQSTTMSMNSPVLRSDMFFRMVRDNGWMDDFVTIKHHTVVTDYLLKELKAEKKYLASKVKEYDT